MKMEELQTIVESYYLMQPVISFAGGAVVGTLVRLYETYESRRDGTEKNRWLPSGALFGLISNVGFVGGVEMYVANISAASVGDYLATKVIDDITD